MTRVKTCYSLNASASKCNLLFILHSLGMFVFVAVTLNNMFYPNQTVVQIIIVENRSRVSVRSRTRQIPMIL